MLHWESVYSTIWQLFPQCKKFFQVSTQPLMYDLLAICHLLYKHKQEPIQCLIPWSIACCDGNTLLKIFASVTVSCSWIRLLIDTYYSQLAFCPNDNRSEILQGNPFAATYNITIILVTKHRFLAHSEIIDPFSTKQLAFKILSNPSKSLSCILFRSPR